VSRKPMMAGNWKMYKNAAEAVTLVRAIGESMTDDHGPEVVVCPPFTALKSVSVTLEYDRFAIGLGAQNMHWEAEGAFTGEISPSMLKQLRVDYVILGHSERRQYFHETDEMINKKIKAALAHELKPIFCVGESLEQRDAGQTTQVVGDQVTAGLSDIGDDLADRLVVAYEPVWAIGTGRVAEPNEANDVIRHIRAVLAASLGTETAQAVRILYGGSVKPDNVRAIMDEPEIDGALVGGASLEAETFLRLINYQ
jgi:triosephosphate isomerase (TIM)